MELENCITSVSVIRQLQQIFVDYVFNLEKVLYEKDGIPFSDLDFPDNKDVIEMLTRKNTGAEATPSVIF